MGIKDNFSQAVKELWKKDGLEDNSGDALRGDQQTELDKYLAQQNAAQGAAGVPVQPGMTQTAQGMPGVQVPPVQGAAQNAGAPYVAQPGITQAYPGQDVNEAGIPLETPYYRTQVPQNPPPSQAQGAAAQGTAQGAPAQGVPAQGAPMQGAAAAGAAMQGVPMQGAAVPPPVSDGGYVGATGFGGANSYGGGGYVPPAAAGGNTFETPSDTEEMTVISKNTVIDGNVRSLANMQVDGNIKGNVETTRNIDMSGKVVGDVTCNNANMNSAAMQGNVVLKGKMRMDRDTILIGDLTSQYADVNGRIRGKMEIAGKAELKRDAIVFGDINASTIAVTDGAIIQGYVNTTFLSKEDSRNVFPEAISLETKDTKASS